ncbi:MAG: GxxExxY protein [Pirellulales bacterium]
MADKPFSGKHAELTDRILAAFYKVHRVMGFGFHEKVYENALAIELRQQGMEYEQQKEIPVFYDGKIVGVYVADIVVHGIVLLELKSVRQLIGQHEAQLLNYLKATPIEVGLLLNFGPVAEVKRRIFDNDVKGSLLWTSRNNESGE